MSGLLENRWQNITLSMLLRLFNLVLSLFHSCFDEICNFLIYISPKL